jgi:hypothetical protein
MQDLDVDHRDYYDFKRKLFAADRLYTEAVWVSFCIISFLLRVRVLNANVLTNILHWEISTAVISLFV